MSECLKDFECSSYLCYLKDVVSSVEIGIQNLNIELSQMSNILNDFASLEGEIFKKLRHEFSDVFPEQLPEGLPPSRGVDHGIELLLGSSHVSLFPYRMSVKEEDEVARQLKNYLKMGHIQSSKSPWGVS